MKLIILIAILTLIGCGSENGPESEPNSKVCMCDIDYDGVIGCVEFEPNITTLNCSGDNEKTILLDCAEKIQRLPKTDCKDDKYKLMKYGEACMNIENGEFIPLTDPCDDNDSIVIQNTNSTTNPSN